jgi:L-ascorbate metabolism protein UlaG (beta-lactamase superfamily)
MKITYFGQSCFLLETQGTHLLFDPAMSYNPLAQGVDRDAIPADYILISHAHEDHIADVVQIARRTGATIVGIWEVYGWASRQGFAAHPMNIGGSWQFPFGRVKMVSAVHSSSLPDGSYGGVAAGFVLEVEGKTLYFAGDTALTYDMKLIADEFTVDFALLPIGDNFTMGYRDAIRAAQFVGTQRVIGMHFDSFGFIQIDHQVVSEAFAAAGLQLTLPTIGQTWEV